MSKLSHIGPGGEARMVDVTGKFATARTAIAEGRIRMKPETLALVLEGNGPKGHVLGPARVAGIMAAKKTAELIPLCHPLSLSFIGLEFTAGRERPEVIARAEVRTNDRTGVEMEAMTAVAVALLTIYDMAKAVDRAMVIGEIRLLEKTGGAQGDYHADDPADG
jgi:cyclic pyranopterin phosphate synthase